MHTKFTHAAKSQIGHPALYKMQNLQCSAQGETYGSAYASVVTVRWIAALLLQSGQQSWSWHNSSKYYTADNNTRVHIYLFHCELGSSMRVVLYHVSCSNIKLVALSEGMANGANELSNGSLHLVTLRCFAVQDGGALLLVCLVWPRGLAGAAQAPAHSSAAVCHRLHLQPGLCHPGHCADPGRHPQSHLLHAKVVTEFFARIADLSSAYCRALVLPGLS